MIDALDELLEEFPRSGIWKYEDTLKFRGAPWNHKRICRVFSLGLNLPRKAKKRVPERDPLPLAVPAQPNQFWSADFMSDSLYQRSRFRLFNLIDDYNREAIAMEVDTSLRSARLVRLFDRIKTERPMLDILRTDSGPEFLGEVFTDWCAEHGIFVDHIEPGKPNQNAFIERFNRSVRNEVLDLYLFRNLEQVREQISQWKMKYHEHRPHDSLGGLPPVTYAKLNAGNYSYDLSPYCGSLRILRNLCFLGGGSGASFRI